MNRELLGLRMRNFRDIIFVWTRVYKAIFKPALVYLDKVYIKITKKKNIFLFFWNFLQKYF